MKVAEVEIVNVRIVVTGRSYHQADGLPDELTLPDGASLDDALNALRQAAGESLLPASCLIAVCGQHLGTIADHEAASLKDGDELLLLAPVAGG